MVRASSSQPGQCYIKYNAKQRDQHRYMAKIVDLETAWG